MKFSKSSQLFLVSAIGLVLATFLTACQIVTVDYVIVADSSKISTFAADSESGALRQAVTPTTTGVSSPVAMALSPDYADLYVANQGNNTVVHYTIGLDGSLTSKDSVTVAAPVALAVNAASTYLYVLSGTTSATLAAYPLSSGTIGTLAASRALTVSGDFDTDTFVPTAVTVLANNNAVYATVYDQSVYNPGGSTKAGDSNNPGWVFGFTTGSGGALTPITNSNGNGLAYWTAGIKPTGIVSDPTNRFVYITDYASNDMVGYGINSDSSLNFLLNGPFKTGNEPQAITIDPRGKFVYVANSLDSSVSAYSIDLTTGTPSAAVNVTGSTTNSTDTEPVALVVDPALGRFVYTANNLGNSVSGFKLDPTAGTLQPTQATPYGTASTGNNVPLSKPTAIVSVPHGNHAVQSITP